MKRFCLAVALTALCGLAHAAHVPSRILMVGNGESVGQRWHANVRKIGNDIYVIDLPKGYDESAMRDRVALEGNVVELDEIVSPAFVPNDPLYPNQWHLRAVNAAAAWDVSTGVGVTIAILDSGVQSNHPDLAAHMVPGWDVYHNTADTTDLTGHGTAVAGTAAAVLNNGIGLAGVAGGASIMPVRIVTDSTGYTTLSIIATGITYAANHGARVANASYMNVYKSAVCISAAQYLQGKGGQLVVSANNNAVNENTNAVPSMVVVSAVDKTLTLASFSSWGNMVTVTAPGVDVETTIWGSQYNCLGCGAVGTSFATPIAAGTLALEFAANPSLTPAQAVSILTSTATDLGAPGWDAQYGYGLVNAAAAANAAKAYTAPPPVVDTTPPVVTLSAPWPGTKLSTNTKIIASATDNVGVTSLSLYLDGTLKTVTNASSLTYVWNTSKVAVGAHTITVTARDAAGNQASKSITVYR